MDYNNFISQKIYSGNPQQVLNKDVDDSVFNIGEYSLNDLFFLFGEIEISFTLYNVMFSEYLLKHEVDAEDYNINNVIGELGMYKLNVSESISKIQDIDADSSEFTRSIYHLKKDLIIFTYAILYTIEYLFNYIIKDEMEIKKLQYVQEKINLLLNQL